MKRLVRDFVEVSQDPYRYLASWKQTHQQRLIAMVGMHIPEEIVHAAGALPVRLPHFGEPIVHASFRLQGFFCAYARSVLEAGLRGALAFADGIVLNDICHTIRATTGILERESERMPWLRFLWLPPDIGKPQALAYAVRELEGFRTDLEGVVGHPITDEALWQSIAMYNRQRRLLRRLYQARRDRPGVLSAREMGAVVTAGMLTQKEDHANRVARLLEMMEGHERQSVRSAVPLVISGSLCEAPPDEILGLIEDVGGVVVDDDLFTGSRSFVTDVPEDGGNPLEALARAYLGMVAPCPTRHRDGWDLGNYLVQMAQHSHARGVVVMIVKYCEPHDYYKPMVERTLEQAGIASLFLETEHEDMEMGQVRTRLQAFVESLRAPRASERMA